MALTRKGCKAMGLTDEQTESIIEAHVEVKNELERRLAEYKEAAEKLPDIQKELDDLKKGDGNDYKALYESEKQAHEQTKNDYAAKETAGKVREAYRTMLREAGVAEKYLNTAMKATDFAGMKLGEDGKLEDAENLLNGAKTEWADFITTRRTNGAEVPTPPSGGTGRMTREEIYKKDEHGRYLLSTAERQRALAETLENEN